ncbi:hypothetical protein [Actinokineospora terrae]|uniref:hypothetical protein n=1 Tax=Actinokineospora terrae TaxID=155974 RepID=UPI000B8612BF|nr:hypothetical protein [Actinokineospora terrae]
MAVGDCAAHPRQRHSQPGKQGHGEIVKSMSGKPKTSEIDLGTYRDHTRARGHVNSLRCVGPARRHDRPTVDRVRVIPPTSVAGS